LTSTKSDKPQEKGVGQVIKEIRVSEPHRIDFCSKWSYPTPNGIKFFRNINNCVKNSLRYNGEAEYLTNNPKEHSWLVGDALYRESGSAIAKEIGLARMRMGNKPPPKTHEKWKAVKGRSQLKVDSDCDLREELETYHQFTGKCKTQ